MITFISDWTQDQITQLVLVVAGLAAVLKLGHMSYVFMRSMIDVNEFIQHELKENSGKSLRDYIARNDKRVELLFDHLGIDLPAELQSPKEEK